MEQWVDIEGYEGLYQVSNYGNVKSLNYKRTEQERILRQTDNGWGYLRVDLTKNNKRKTHQIHRLVASAFIDNPDNLPQVNHKDECKTNNFVFVNSDGSIDEEKSNLEWCTPEYNTNYGTRNIRSGEALKGKPHAETKKVAIDMLNKQGEFIRQFHSITEAERWLQNNGFQTASHAHICKCCKGKRDTAYGFKWRYMTEN